MKKEFAENIKNHIREYLPADCQDAKITLEKVTKGNDRTLTGLIIRTNNETVAPAIYLEHYEEQFSKLYEDMTRELITEKRFQMLSARYDSEQEELSARIKELEKSAIEDREQLSSIEQFAEQISGYAGITELNFKIINQLIEKILVSEPVEVDGQKIQRLTIHYKFIGALETLE